MAGQAGGRWVSRAGGALRRAAPYVDEASRRARRAAFVAAVRAAAARVGAQVDLQLPPDLRVGRDVRVTFEPGSCNRLVLGPASELHDRALIMLKGGSIEGGPRVVLRRDAIVNVAGRLVLHGDNQLSWGSVVHCSQLVELGEMAGLAEHVTVADSSHFFTTPDEHFWHNVRLGSVHIGRNTWICPKAVLVRGARVGDHCIVASGSVVTGEVPDGSLASGVPATVRPLNLPWGESLTEWRIPPSQN